MTIPFLWLSQYPKNRHFLEVFWVNNKLQCFRYTANNFLPSIAQLKPMLGSLITLLALYVTTTLMALVAVSCTVICCAWAIPSWRQRLAESRAASQFRETTTGGLTGWPARIGSRLIFAGLIICTLISWYSAYSVLAALIAASP
jgi:hypothetical protein